MKAKIRTTLGRVKLLKSGGCPKGSVMRRGGKSRRKSCVSRKSLTLGRRRRRR